MLHIKVQKKSPYPYGKRNFNGGRHKKMIFQTYGDTIWVGVKMKDMDEFLYKIK
jgi:hypothetical protein